jgi:hypothetical protein
LKENSPETGTVALRKAEENTASANEEIVVRKGLKVKFFVM